MQIIASGELASWLTVDSGQWTNWTRGTLCLSTCDVNCWLLISLHDEFTANSNFTINAGLILGPVRKGGTLIPEGGDVTLGYLGNAQNSGGGREVPACKHITFLSPLFTLPLVINRPGVAGVVL